MRRLVSQREITRRAPAGLVIALIVLPACTTKNPAPAAEENALASATPKLDLWAGVPPIAAATSDTPDELLPVPGPKPPPSVQETAELPFPPSPQQSEETQDRPSSSGPLQVLRTTPNQKQPGLIASVSAVFNQPMVPLATIDELKLERSPMSIAPTPKGTFRWLGTQMIAFEPSGRMPFSTTYTARVAAGESSALGTKLAKEVTWKFTTPGLGVETHSPNEWESASLDTLVVVRFNQAIDREKLAAALELRDGSEARAFESVPPDMWERLDEPWRSRASAGPAEYTLVLRPSAPLEPNTSYRLTIPAGVYGEGPNKSPALQLGFKTYPPLSLGGPQCRGSYSWDCSADSGVKIDATNPLVSDPSVENKIRVTPEVPELKITVAGAIHLTGKFRGLGTYTLAVDPGLRDIHGQELKAPYRSTFTVPALTPSLTLADSTFDPLVLEPSHSGLLSTRATGLTSVEVAARSFTPDAIPTILSGRHFDWTGAWPDALTSPSWHKTFAVHDSRVEPALLSLDARTMGASAGSLLFFGARSNLMGEPSWKSRLTFSQVVQITRLGVTAALDGASGVAFVTDIETGEPLAGVELALRSDTRDVWTGVTDPTGAAALSYSRGLDRPYLLARYQGEIAYLPLQQTADGSWGSWTYNERNDQARVFFYTDRQPYKPGELVHLQGIVRNETRGPAGAVKLWRTDTTANYVVTSPRGHELAKGELKIGPFGTFSVNIPIPTDADTGTYDVVLTTPGGIFSNTHSFHFSLEIQHFRSPEFAVKVQRPAAAPLIYADILEAEITANYLHGAPLVGAAVSYTLRREDTPFRPPGGENEAFSFGHGAMNWWRSDSWHAPARPSGVLVRQGKGETDARGVLAVRHLLAAHETPWGQKAPLPAAQPPNSPRAPALNADETPGPSSYTLEANVTDENRQAIASRSTYVVHPASEYVGVRSDRSVYRAGERAKLEALVVDIAGQRITDRALTLTLVRKETSRSATDKGGRWSYNYETREIEVGACKLRSELAPVGCELVVDKAGSYDVRALITDPAGRKALSKHPLFVYGDDAVVWQQDQRRVDLVPDKRSYEPGDTATLLVRSPFDRARGLMVIEREGIVSHQLISVEGAAAALQVPLAEAQIPGVRASIILVRGRTEVPGAPPGQDLGRPAYAVGHIDLKIETTRKKIALSVLPEKTEVAPKDTLRLTLRASDAKGTPQKALVALMVVDEGVLSLMGYQTPDPLAFFHHEREPGVSLYDLRQFLLARKDVDVAAPQQRRLDVDPRQDRATGDDVWGDLTGSEVGEAYGVGGLGLIGTGRGGGGTGEGTIGLGNIATIGKGGGGSGYGRGAAAMADAAPREERKEAPSARPRPSAAAIDVATAMNQPVALRSVFAATAYFNAEVQLDATGETQLEIPMPENLTSFRIMAVAVDPEHADRFGSGEAAVMVRKPIMLRPNLPRFANFADRFEASVMVDNQTDEPQAILVGTRGTNVVLSGDTTLGIEVAAGESKEVRFPMAVDRAGTMRLQFAALSNGGRDATELSLPVHYPATRQAFADYGVTSQSVLRALKIPADALPAFGGLDLSMSSSALTGLEDAVEFLVGYRYECSEQLASRLLPIFVLGPVLEQFPIATIRDLARRQELGREGVAKLQSRQNWDGGYRYWDEPARSSPYLTSWVTFALLEGKTAGFSIDEERLARALRYLEDFVQSGEATPWGRYYDHTSRAFALWLLSRESRGQELFERVYARRKDLPLYAQAQLLAVAHRFGLAAPRATLLKEFRGKVVETAKTAHFVESTRQEDIYGLQVLMHSDVQSDAIALLSLLEVAPDDPLLPKVMAGIMDERDPKKGGQWGTTHANAWALLAASRYFTAIEKELPDYVARIWLDTTFAGERAFKGRSLTTLAQEVPMKRLLADPPQQLLLSKEGPGLLYYRLGLRYAPADLTLKPESQGFTVHRSYEPLAQGGDAPDPDSVKRLPDGTWEIKAGTLVRVNLTLIASDRASFVVVDDPLPAGLEGQNSKFATTLRDVQGGVESQGQDLDDTSRGGWWYWRPWWRFDHSELRDDRMLLFADHLPAGVYTYSYTARATTIGEFTLPPVRAEAMYTPERFGHGASGKVRVVE